MIFFSRLKRIEQKLNEILYKLNNLDYEYKPLEQRNVIEKLEHNIFSYSPLLDSLTNRKKNEKNSQSEEGGSGTPSPE